MTSVAPGAPGPVPHDHATARRRRYDDPAGRARRWSGLDADARHAAAALDPVGFLADYLPVRERDDGALAVLLRGEAGRAPGVPGRGVVTVVTGTPADAASTDCAAVLAPFVAAAGPGAVTGVGLVRHRTGPVGTTASDRRWRCALRAAAVQAGVEDLGMAVRHEDGSLWRVD